MKTMWQKTGLICVWWGVMFLLKHNLSAIPQNELPQFIGSIKLQAPAVVLLLEDS